MDQLILLPEKEAVKAHFDSGNCRMLFRMLLACVLLALAIAVAAAAAESYRQLIVPVLNLALIRLLYLIRERDVFTRHFRLILLGFLLAQGLLWKAAFFSKWPGFHPADFVAPALLLCFQLPPGLLAVPLGSFWSLSVGRNVVEAAMDVAELEYGYIIGQTAMTVLVFSIVNALTQKKRREFLVNWRRESHRHRERRRMREELDDARKIQLSMLPRTEPRIPWLDVAGISIPASEVGGDYYDYFALSESRQAIVIGDVAGHGVASGLLLSAVRSSLHILHEYDLEPAEILAKIDRMLRQTSVERSFVTLSYALFDAEKHTLTFSAAGHPPLLRLSGADRRVDELALHALPLGTRLGSDVSQRTIEIYEDDVFVLTTDGIAETLNSRGDVYGDDRLRQRLAGMSPQRSAKEIRDTVLGDVWTFKADGVQLDDITIVVAKMR